MPRGRAGHYEVIDFLAVLFGYSISGERTLETFYEHLHPFATADHWRRSPESACPLARRSRAFCVPCRFRLSKPCAASFSTSLVARPLTKEGQRGELLDRAGGQWEVFDIDGTRETARQRALPKREDLPPARRRLDEVCAAGYTGRKHGEVVRTRTVVSQAHAYQWLGSFGNRGNGEYREELAHALGVIRR